MGRQAKNLTGQDFGMLHVIRRSRSKKARELGSAMWVCKCRNCGNVCVVNGKYLRNGQAKSCGCLRGGKQNIMTDEEMSMPSLSLTRLGVGVSDPYRNLADAIVCVAADDYRVALRDKKKKVLKEVEDFFHSEWYSVLCDLDPDLILKSVRQEYRREQCEEVLV